MEMEMQVGKWYKFKNNDDRRDYIYYHHTNKSPADAIGECPFQVVCMREINIVTEIIIYKNGKQEYFSVMGDERLSSMITPSEYCFFEEVKDPTTEELDEEIASNLALREEELYSCMTSSQRGDGYFIRLSDSPLQKCKEFAEEWLRDNIDDQVVIIKGILSFTAERSVIINEAKF